MMTDSFLIRALDYRISAAIVFFVLLLMLNTAKPRRRFFLRAGLTLVVMGGVSWVIRYVTEELFAQDLRLQGAGYMLQLLSALIRFCQAIGGAFFDFSKIQRLKDEIIHII